jgi:hypothetical protein
MRHEIPTETSQGTRQEFPFDDNVASDPTLQDCESYIPDTPLQGYASSQVNIPPAVPFHAANHELYRIHRELCEAARELSRRKNEDYACQSDPFRNFRYFGSLGILVRLSDKLARLRSFEERGVFSVTDENLRDTVMDLINYAIIYYAYKKSEEK